MKATLVTSVFLQLLAASGIAATTTKKTTAKTTAKTTVVCHTELGLKSTKHVPTDTVTKTSSHQPTVTKTIQPVVTKKVSHWVTVTKLATKTFTVTDSTVTDTFSTTTTEFSVETDTITGTVTTTQTDTDTTSSTSTTVIPTTEGFRPIKDTLNSYFLNGPQRRGASNVHARAAKKGVQAYSYPVKVHCTKSVPNTKTKTVSKTVYPTTKTVNVYSTSTKTKTLSTTTTLVPSDVSVTVTSTSTSSVTTFTTVFETSTIHTTTTTTNVLPGPTVWNACKPENIFGANFNNGGVGYYATNVDNNGPGVGSDFQTVADGAATAVECCNACQLFGTCETWIFRGRNRNCFLLFHEGETCNSQVNHPNYILSKKGSDTGAGYVVGNGNCGYTYSGNSDGSVFYVDGV
ncbi:hypothetical protein BGZ63DRAFT_434783 [Mariannaea sp. PMI_226]|nr:hypothetical protein BGZ63DRAFT_434783 [Mariannaea sp. PMI_226]